jgi:hypothetical protein
MEFDVVIQPWTLGWSQVDISYAIADLRRPIPDGNRKSSTASLRFLYTSVSLSDLHPRDCNTCDNASMSGSHSSSRCYPGFGVRRRIGESLRQYRVSIFAIFRPSVRRLFSRIYRCPPTYARLVWQNADPGRRVRLSLAIICCPPTRTNTDSLGYASQVRPVLSPAALGFLVKRSAPTSAWISVATPRH